MALPKWSSGNIDSLYHVLPISPLEGPFLKCSSFNGFPHGGSFLVFLHSVFFTVTDQFSCNWIPSKKRYFQYFCATWFFLVHSRKLTFLLSSKRIDTINRIVDAVSVSANESRCLRSVVREFQRIIWKLNPSGRARVHGTIFLRKNFFSNSTFYFLFDSLWSFQRKLMLMKLLAIPVSLSLHLVLCSSRHGTSVEW